VDLLWLGEIDGAPGLVVDDGDAEYGRYVPHVLELELLKQLALHTLNSIQSANHKQVIDVDRDDDLMSSVITLLSVGVVLLQIIGLVINAVQVMCVETWVGGACDEADIHQILVKGTIPGEWGLLEAIEHFLELADMVWSLGIDKAFRLGDIDLFM
jgi:hypothetical protein